MTSERGSMTGAAVRRRADQAAGGVGGRGRRRVDEYEAFARAYIERMYQAGWTARMIAEQEACGTLAGPWNLEIRHNLVTVERFGSDRVYRARATDLLPTVPAQLSLF